MGELEPEVAGASRPWDLLIGIMGEDAQATLRNCGGWCLKWQGRPARGIG